MAYLVKGELLVYQSFIPGGKCTMPLTNINSDWVSNASSGLCIILFIYVGPLFNSHLWVPPAESNLPGLI